MNPHSGRRARRTAGGAGWTPRRTRLTIWAALSLPLVIAAVVLLSRRWHPVLDLAMTEFRVRDVGGWHSPLIGLPGRIGTFPDQGSHPGPLSFYLLAPVYRLFGSTAWGLLVAMIVLNIMAVGAALWIAARRGGTAMVAVVGVVLVVLMRGYGTSVLEQPWNPYLPVLFWFVVLLATWSVLQGDLTMAIVASAAGSLCAQTHIPYLPLALGMLGVCAVTMAVTWVRQPPMRRAVQRATAWSVLVAAVLWLPVFVDQLRRTPGNISMLREHFTNPPADEPAVGVGEGLRLLLRHLDVVRLVRLSVGGDGYFVRAGFRLDGSIVPGLVVLLIWLVSVVVAVRVRHRGLLLADLVIAWSLVLAAASMGRIFGKVWYYLTLWMWSTTVLMVAMTLWTALIVAQRRRPVSGASGRSRSATMAAWAVGAVGAVSLVSFTIEAVSATAPEEHVSDTLGALIAPTVAALESGLGGATGHDGRYTVTYNDALYFGEQAYGLVSELERRGFDAGMPSTWRVPVTAHRVITEQQATVQLRLAVGRYIDTVAALPGAVEVVRYDPRTLAEVGRGEQLRAQLRASLSAAGLDELVAMIDENLFGLQLDPRVTPEVQSMVDELLQLGAPTAVFILPPETGA